MSAVVQPIRTVPISPPASKAASRARSRVSAITTSARSMISSPTGVSDDPFAVRSNSLSFSSSSSRATLLERLGWDTPSASAALAKLPCLRMADHLSEASKRPGPMALSSASLRRSLPMAVYRPPGSHQGRSSTAGLSRNRPSASRLAPDVPDGGDEPRRRSQRRRTESAGPAGAGPRRGAGAGGRRMGTGAPVTAFRERLRIGRRAGLRDRRSRWPPAGRPRAARRSPARPWGSQHREDAPPNAKSRLAAIGVLIGLREGQREAAHVVRGGHQGV